MLNSMHKWVSWLRYSVMYLGNPPWDTGITPPELIQFIHHHPPGRAIDLGCGTGTNLVALGKAGWQVVGVEFIARAADVSRRRLESEDLQGEVRTGDVANLETIRGSYDLVLDIGCYHGLSLASRVAYRSNLAEILLPHGWFLIYAHWVNENGSSRIGISNDDLVKFQYILDLEDRKDSLDRLGRQASWIRYRKKG